MEFAEVVVKAAWDRQGGRCAKCGRWLVWTQRGRESVTGAWQPHHKNPQDRDRCNAPEDCIILCSGMADCHFRHGHGGIDWGHYASLDDSTLLFLHAGEDETERSPKADMGREGSLIETFFAITEVKPKDARPSRKRSTKRSPQGRAGARAKKRAADDLGFASDR